MAPGAASGNADEENAEGEGGEEGEDESKEAAGSKEGSQPPAREANAEDVDIKLEDGKEAGAEAGPSVLEVTSKQGEQGEPEESLALVSAREEGVAPAKLYKETATAPTSPTASAQLQDGIGLPNLTAAAKDAPPIADATAEVSVEEQAAPGADVTERTAAMEVD